MSPSASTAVKADQTVIMDYAVGNLSPAKHIIVACQAEISNDVARAVSFQEDIAANMLEDGPSVPLSSHFIGEALARLPMNCANDRELSQQQSTNFAPQTLKDVLGEGLKNMRWTSLVPGVAVHNVLGSRRQKTGDRLYLLKAKAGMKMPPHSHNGEEWTLILQGGYSEDGVSYQRGDLHIENDSATHAPHINDGEDCICLVMTQGPLQMKPLLAKFIQSVIGI